MNKLIFSLSLLVMMMSCEQNPGKVDIPFKYGRHIYLNCTINDTCKANLIFDTGAYNFYMDSTYNEISGPHYFVIPEHLDVNVPNYPKQKEIKIRCASIDYKPEHTWVINPRAAFGKQCDGIVGWDMLAGKIVKIDYIKKVMTITEPEAIDIDGSYTSIPWEIKGKWFMVELEVAVSANLKIKGKFIFDTGFGGTVNFSGAATRKYQLDTIAGEKVKYVMDWRVINTQRSYGCAMRAKSIKLGGFELKDPTVEYYQDTTGILGETEYLGLLGNRFFEHFDVVIDLSQKRLFMKPNKNYKEPMKMFDIGIGVIDRTDICDGLIVKSLSMDSKAINAGVMIGDVITHINGKPVKHNSEKLWDEAYDQKQKEVSFTFRRKDSIYKLNLRSEERLK